MLKRIVDYSAVGLALVAVALAATGIYFGWQARKTAEETDRSIEEALQVAPDASASSAFVEARRTLTEANTLVEKAENASASANVILSFIESGSILIGVLITLGAVVLGASLQDVRSRIDKSTQDAQALLDKSENKMRSLEDEMRQKLAEAVEQDNIRLEEHKSQFSQLEAHLIRQLDEAAMADEKRLQESQQQFADLTRKIEDELERIRTTLNSFHTMVNEAITGAKTEAEKSFRALSLVLLAEQQVRSGNRETAIATLEEAVHLDPKNQTINYLLGYLYVGRKKFGEAVLHLRQALESNPNFSPGLAAMGLAQSRMSDQEPDSLKRDQLRAESEANLVKALMAEPALIDADNESYWGSLGGLRRRQGRDEGAVEAYKKATEVTPNKSYPINNLALLYKKLNQEDEAIEAFNKVIRIAQGALEDRPGDIWARLDLAQAYLVIGELEKSKREYRLVFERVDVPGPLESALNGLRFLQKAPVPPVGIDEVIAMLEKRAKDVQKKTTQERRQADVISN